MIPLVDIPASLLRVGAQQRGDIIKLPEDLDRYRVAVAAGRPDVIVECGTWHGGSARWFAGLGLDVVSVDVASRPFAYRGDRITWLLGDSADPVVAERVATLSAGRRVMVVLDSDHSAAHVAAEIGLYAPMVSPGCHLVVEDGIVRWMPDTGYDGSPLDAIEELLADSPDFARDEVVEAMSATSMYPCGWWIRR